jgi:hypothetical protein
VIGQPHPARSESSPFFRPSLSEFRLRVRPSRSPFAIRPSSVRPGRPLGSNGLDACSEPRPALDLRRSRSSRRLRLERAFQSAPPRNGPKTWHMRHLAVHGDPTVSGLPQESRYQ